jgi:6-bladed beta-propeller
VTLALACWSSRIVPTVTERDSLGIAIIEYASDFPFDTAVAWITEKPPIVTIGNTATDLFDVHAALPLSDGRIVVANGGSNEILIFDGDGSLLHRSGGNGNGPGEFFALSFLSVGRDDSLFRL